MGDDNDWVDEVGDLTECGEDDVVYGHMVSGLHEIHHPQFVKTYVIYSHAFFPYLTCAI